MILSVNIVHCLFILIVLNFLLLTLQWWFDIIMRYLLQVGRPLKQTCALMSNHGHIWVTIPIDLPHCILINLKHLSTMKPLKFILASLLSAMTTFKFSHKIICVAPSLECMSKHTIVHILQYLISNMWYTWIIRFKTNHISLYSTCELMVFGVRELQRGNHAWELDNSRSKIFALELDNSN